MKLLPLLLASLLWLVPSARQDSPELKEAAELTESVVKLICEKRYSDALAPAKGAFEKTRPGLRSIQYNFVNRSSR